jgi:hypothetical protein
VTRFSASSSSQSLSALDRTAAGPETLRVLLLGVDIANKTRSDFVNTFRYESKELNEAGATLDVWLPPDTERGRSEVDPSKHPFGVHKKMQNLPIEFCEQPHET